MVFISKYKFALSAFCVSEGRFSEYVKCVGRRLNVFDTFNVISVLSYFADALTVSGTKGGLKKLPKS